MGCELLVVPGNLASSLAFSVLIPKNRIENYGKKSGLYKGHYGIWICLEFSDSSPQTVGVWKILQFYLKLGYLIQWSPIIIGGPRVMTEPRYTMS